MAKTRSMARAITESINEQEQALAPMVDDLGVITGGGMLAPPSLLLSPADPFAEMMLDAAEDSGLPQASSLISNDEGSEPPEEAPDEEPEAEEPEPEEAPEDDDLEPEPEEPEPPVDEPTTPDEPTPDEYGDDFDVEAPEFDDEDGEGALDVPKDFSDELKQLDDLEEPIEEATWGELDKAHGGLSTPGKMPCATYSTLAGAVGGHRITKVAGQLVKKGELDVDPSEIRGTCPIGAKLAEVPGTVCYGCYAAGGRYNSDSTLAGMIKRAVMMHRTVRDKAKLDEWVDAMDETVKKKGERYFRWHDSGDILGPSHLEAIAEIARRNPKVKFWLPTKEFSTVRRWMLRHKADFPNNLVIRLSAWMLFDVISPEAPLVASSVGSGEGSKCPATYYPESHGHTCDGEISGKPCRRCWNRNIENVDYSYHGPTSFFRQALAVSGIEEPRSKQPEGMRSRLWSPVKKPRGWKAPDFRKLQRALVKGQIEVPEAPEPRPKSIRPKGLY